MYSASLGKPWEYRQIKVMGVNIMLFENQKTQWLISTLSYPIWTKNWKRQPTFRGSGTNPRKICACCFCLYGSVWALLMLISSVASFRLPMHLPVTSHPFLCKYDQQTYCFYSVNFGGIAVLSQRVRQG